MSTPGYVQGTHFWFMSINVHTPDTDRIAYFQGTTSPAPGETRMDVFERILEEVAEREPLLRGTGQAAVLAFDIQPNQL